MMTCFENLRLYRVDAAYLKYLYDVDSEVEFRDDGSYERKPFLGILSHDRGFKYFVPLTSRKPRHSDADCVGEAHYLIYEDYKSGKPSQKDVLKTLEDGTVIRILASLEIMKMIPVPDGFYTRIDFSSLNGKYRNLHKKEHRFCRGIRKDILLKAQSIYNEQVETEIVHERYCNYLLLEEACSRYLASYHKSVMEFTN